MKKLIATLLLVALNACVTRTVTFRGPPAVADLRFEGRALATTRCEVAVVEEDHSNGHTAAVAVLVPLCILTAGRGCASPGAKPTTTHTVTAERCTKSRANVLPKAAS